MACMKRFVLILAILLLAAPIFGIAVGEPTVDLGSADSSEAGSPEVTAEVIVPIDSEPVIPSYVEAGEDSLFREAAAVAWSYVRTQYQPETGLTNSVIDYPYATIWDIGSTLAAYYCAHELGLLGETDFHSRMGRALETLGGLPLFANAAFNKNYQVSRGVPAGRNDREAAEGYGWSATDIGRLLVWLEIIATAHSEHRAAAKGVMERLALDRIVVDGYLWGEDLDATGRRRRYQEGRLGYEQYAAAGFALWDARADLALRMAENSEEVDVMGIPVLRDTRVGGHLTSEPFLLMGMEIGWWSPQWRDLAARVLAAQQARFDRTGQITIVTEDAIPLAPHFFYYYTIHQAGENFAVVALNQPEPLDGPRWISSKGAFGWYALEPGPYTWQALQAVLPAADSDTGWSSGIYEESREPTLGQNINTSAVILEAALYHRLRQPILSAAQGVREVQ